MRCVIALFVAAAIMAASTEARAPRFRAGNVRPNGMLGLKKPLDPSLLKYKKLLGVNSVKVAQSLPKRALFSDADLAAVPTNFTWRTSPLKNPIRNQGDCGSCWAVSTVSAISDRYNIAAGKKLNWELSALDVTTCDTSDDGCNGGDPGEALNYIQQSGNAVATCLPYLAPAGPIPTCPPAQQPCLNFVATPNCPSTCADGSSLSAAKKYISNAYSVSSDVSQISAEIYNNGPVIAAFTVYADFLTFNFTGGAVYSYQTGDALGGHAVEVVGYGVHNGVPYWEVANSWTTTWGWNGYFRIKAGDDDCGFEDSIVAGTPSS